MRVGKYDVVVDSGPSYTTKREHAVESQGAIIAAVPEAMGVIGDLFLRNMDVPGSQEMADRWKRTIPPQVLGDEDGEADEGQIQAALQECQQKLEAINAYAQKIEQESQKMEQENSILKAGLELKKEELVLKSREVDLKREELALKTQVDMRKIAIEEEKLALEVVAGE
jgi:hypothetical protein